LLSWLYGEREADRIIHAAHFRSRKSSKSKKEKKKEAFIADIKETIENDKKVVRGLIKLINEKYGKVIYDEYNFPTDLIEGVCLEKIFTREERKH
jgi:hypothetical protein